MVDRILDLIQDGFPLESRPYEALTLRLNREGMAVPLFEEDVFKTVCRLRESGVVRRLGGVYDSRKLGFISRLCAGVVSEDGLEEFASVVDEEPAITHNYVRSHYYNVWFTVIAQSPEAVNEIVEGLKFKTKLKNVHVLNSSKMFKVNTVFKKSENLNMTKNSPLPVSSGVLFDGECRKHVSLVSSNLPFTLTPYKDWAVKLEMREEDLLNRIKEDLACGRMRRFGAVLRHQKAGFEANAMVVFRVPENVVEQVGKILAQSDFVSHCYDRSPFENFDFNLYAMFHGQNEQDLLDKLNFINKKFINLYKSSFPMAVLHSLRELKKTSYRFF
ncbi:MAG: Lrp/AsnC family transcriptional regulator [Fibrobacteraceae bacterium]|nr:Lrp/AsnC family transcriptional regulator [Fibrobacteraceae bacterium]